MIENAMELKEAVAKCITDKEYQETPIMQGMLINASILALYYRADWLAETPTTVVPVLELVADYLEHGDVSKDYKEMPTMHFMGGRAEDHALDMLQRMLGFVETVTDSTQLLELVAESNIATLNKIVTMERDYSVDEWLLYYPMYQVDFARYGRSLAEAEQAAEAAETVEATEEAVAEVVDTTADAVAVVAEAAEEAVAEVAVASDVAVTEVVEAASAAVSSDEITDTVDLDAEVDAMVAEVISSTPQPTVSTSSGGGSSSDGMSGLAIAGCVVAAAAAIYGGYRIMTDSEVDTTVVDLNDCW